MGARWVTARELTAMRLRGNELLEWAQYLDAGGPVSQSVSKVTPYWAITRHGTPPGGQSGASVSWVSLDSRRVVT
jgi:hypothetical protein